jgi:diazepam-binding inhibitor (GABA receptor modulating acyl-CoA-binding protein)
MSFEDIAAKIALEGKKGNIKLKDEEALLLYGLYKQGTVGDVNIDKPGFFAMTDKAKWTAWDEKKGKSKEQAQN